MHHFLNRKTVPPHRDTHSLRYTHKHTHTHTMGQAQARLCLRLLQVQKRGVWKWASQKREAQDEVCYSFSPRGASTTRSRGESAHCPHAPHTYVRVRRRAASSAARPNMLQHLPKKSENECKLRLFYPPRHLCLAPVIKLLSAVTGGGRGGVGGKRCIRHLPVEKKETRSTLLRFFFLYKPDFT